MAGIGTMLFSIATIGLTVTVVAGIAALLVGQVWRRLSPPNTTD